METMSDLLKELDDCGIEYELRDSPLSGDKDKYIVIPFKGVDVGADFADLEYECFSYWLKDGEPIYRTRFSEDRMDHVFRELTDPINFAKSCYNHAKKTEASAKASVTRYERNGDWDKARKAEDKMNRAIRSKNLYQNILNSFDK